MKAKKHREPVCVPGTLCSVCFKPIRSGEPYVFSQSRSGIVHFAHGNHFTRSMEEAEAQKNEKN